MKVITLTLSTAFDRHCFVKGFYPGKECLAEILSIDAAGKGVNISRALKVSETENLALIVTGSQNAGEYCDFLDKDGIAYKEIRLEGRIRENITVHSENCGETRISFADFTAEDKLLDGVFKQISPQIEKNTIVTFTGSLPKGISIHSVYAFLEKIKHLEARIVADSRSLSKDDLLHIRPWMIKPNEEEIEMYLGKKVENISDIIEGAKQFSESGIENVLVSLGKQGMLLCKAGETYLAVPPEIEAVSTIGAGDSSIAGFISAELSGLGIKDKLKSAVAFGSAACLTPGTNPPHAPDIAKIFDMVSVRKI